MNVRSSKDLYPTQLFLGVNWSVLAYGGVSEFDFIGNELLYMEYGFIIIPLTELNLEKSNRSMYYVVICGVAPVGSGSKLSC